MSDQLGELAALGTAVCWAATALSFAAAGERIGSLVVNLLRLLMAIVWLGLVGWFWRGQFLPTDATAFHWGWLSVSGIIGFAFGDLCLFRAFVVLGPRLSSLVMSAAPPLTAIAGWLVLGEHLGPLDLLGMGLTVTGIAWAVADRTPPAPHRVARAAPTVVGVALAFGGALGQALGLVVAKHGMGSYDPFAATQIRVIAGTVGFGALFSLMGRWPRFMAGLHHRSGVLYTALGSIFGPFLGVSLSLIAVRYTTTGVAASIMATSPILVIPLAFFINGERVGVAGIGGTLIACAGVALLFQ